jgi:hypothetical protein
MECITFDEVIESRYSNLIDKINSCLQHTTLISKRYNLPRRLFKNHGIFRDDFEFFFKRLQQDYKLKGWNVTVDDDKLAIEVVIGDGKILPPNGLSDRQITEVDNGLLIEFTKKQSQYPKTYNECYEIMNIPENKLIQCGTYGYKAGLFSKFQELLICRDAYWKIAGEEMGLSGSWAPDYTSTNKLEMHYIYCTANEISYGQAIYPTNKILIFPTRELRNIFLENFKGLIEKCREFL